jgi:hypothetical protein
MIELIGSQFQVHFWDLPEEIGVASSEMSKRRSFLVNGSFQIQLLNDVARPEIEVFLYYLN